MQITLRILGLPGAPTGEQTLRLPEATLADAKKHLMETFPDAHALDKVLVGFLNGRAVGRDWDSVVLNDGDSVMLVVPISGG